MKEEYIKIVNPDEIERKLQYKVFKPVIYLPVFLVLAFILSIIVLVISN